MIKTDKKESERTIKELIQPSWKISRKNGFQSFS